MAEGRTFETGEAKRRFYRTLARSEALDEPRTASGVLSQAVLGVRRLVERRWLALWIAATVLRHTR